MKYLLKTAKIRPDIPASRRIFLCIDFRSEKIKPVISETLSTLPHDPEGV